MNCQAVQNKILALPDPRQVPEQLRAHVVGCGACRAWAEHAARTEGLLEQLPVPPAPADKKSALIAELTRGTVVAEPAPQREPLRDFLRRNATLVGGLAAALLLAVGWWLSVGGGRKDVATPQAPPKDPFLEKVVQRDVALANADTPAKKLQALGGLADDLSAEARGLARIASPDELKDIARWYDRVVKDGLVKRAETLTNSVAMTPAERKAEFEALARRLGTAADEVKKMTGEVSPDAKPALERIADTARDGQKKLTELAGKL
jgi:hypothetical protein